MMLAAINLIDTEHLALLARGDHFPGRQVQGGQAGGGAEVDEVVGDTLHVAQAQPLRGSQGLREQRLGSRAWICVFSSRQSTIAGSGGLRNRPTMSRTFSTKKGSVESLQP
jgi:hypothetical protein